MSYQFRMKRPPLQRLVALVAAFVLLGAQPAVLCGLACLAEHSPAGSFAHQHHDSPEVPCAASAAISAGGVPVEIQPPGVALPWWVAVALPLATPLEPGSASPPALASSLHPDNPDPPPRA